MGEKLAFIRYPETAEDDDEDEKDLEMTLKDQGATTLPFRSQINRTMDDRPRHRACITPTRPHAHTPTRPHAHTPKRFP